MPKACSWNSTPPEIPAHLWSKLSTLYDAPSDIDLFSAGLAETSLSGAHVGPTFACIIGRQVNWLLSDLYTRCNLAVRVNSGTASRRLSSHSNDPFQFKALKDGDRFFFTHTKGSNPNPFTPDQLTNIKVHSILCMP